MTPMYRMPGQRNTDKFNTNKCHVLTLGKFDKIMHNVTHCTGMNWTLCLKKKDLGIIHRYGEELWAAYGRKGHEGKRTDGIVVFIIRQLTHWSHLTQHKILYDLQK